MTARPSPRLPRRVPSLVHPGGRCLVVGTLCPSRAAAEVLLADRVANGDAFPGERVALVPARVLVELGLVSAW